MLLIVLYCILLHSFFVLQVFDSSINLRNILNSYHDGQIILNNYEQFNKLTGLLRNKLTHILITHFLRANSEKKISTEQFLTLSKEICYLFPQENKETYYTPYKNECDIVSPAG